MPISVLLYVCINYNQLMSSLCIMRVWNRRVACGPLCGCEGGNLCGCKVDCVFFWKIVVIFYIMGWVQHCKIFRCVLYFF